MFGIGEKQLVEQYNLTEDTMVKVICIVPLILAISWAELLSMQSCNRFTSNWAHMTELL